jgi:hypothetical protein
LPLLENVLTLEGLKTTLLMSDIKQPATAENFLEEPFKLPSMLNVLTILTIIWNCISIPLSIFGFVRAPASYDAVVQAQDKIDQAPGFLKNMMGPDPVGTARRALENRMPIMLIGIVGAALCLYAAIEMRKQKKIGFSIYVIGDVVPFASYIFIGTAGITGFSAILGIGIVVTFIILYATQLKYLK